MLSNLCSSHGEALAIEPLLVDEAEESSLKGHSVVALATVTKVINSREYGSLIPRPHFWMGPGNEARNMGAQVISTGLPVSVPAYPPLVLITYSVQGWGNAW